MVLPILYRRNTGIYVMKEKWNNLIILDACRFDVFEQVARQNLIDSSTLSKKISRGSNTTTFLMENFGRGEFHDIVYVTGNPYVSKLMKDRFLKVIPVWKTEWNKEKKTVLPESIFNAAVQASKDHPDKRLIIHFMQPHAPFVVDSFKTDTSRRKLGPNVFARHVYKRMKTLDRNWLLKLHEDNLMVAFPYVKRLLTLLGGRTVVTSDHGEALGETIHPLLPIRLYGHLAGARMPSLTQIPWLTVDGGTRLPGGTVNPQGSDIPLLSEGEDEVIEERLRALGYE
jgi:hypothetical protein